MRNSFQPYHAPLALITLLFFFVGGLISALVFPLLLGRMEVTATLDLAEINPQLFRLGVFFSHLLTFAVPGILALAVIFKTDWWRQVDLDKWAASRPALLSCAFFVLTLPLVALSAWLNLQIDLPDWAIQAENGSTKVMEAMVNFTGPASLAMALLGTSLAAGFGEELLFRGILQGKVLDRLPHHAAIWISAIAFSAIHLELAGFLPRMLLGAVLGYTYWWTKSLWVPIVLHMLFNGLQIVAIYYTGEFVADTEVQELPEWYLIAGSFLISVALFLRLEKKGETSK